MLVFSSDTVTHLGKDKSMLLVPNGYIQIKEMLFHET